MDRPFDIVTCEYIDASSDGVAATCTSATLVLYQRGKVGRKMMESSTFSDRVLGLRGAPGLWVMLV
jgi:hypothetical protein